MVSLERRMKGLSCRCSMRCRVVRFYLGEDDIAGGKGQLVEAFVEGGFTLADSQRYGPVSAAKIDLPQGFAHEFGVGRHYHFDEAGVVAFQAGAHYADA